MGGENIGIVDYFEKYHSIQDLRNMLRGAMGGYRKIALHDGGVSSEIEAQVVLLDLLATEKNWYGYLENFWGDFEKYILEDVCVNVTYRRLHEIFYKVCGR